MLIKQQYQVTLLCADNVYKPVSTIVTVEQEEGVDLTKDVAERKAIQNKGIIKICQKRGWDKRGLQRQHMTRVKSRLYDKAKIEQDKIDKYNKIKEQKYAIGEWRRPAGRA